MYSLLTRRSHVLQGIYIYDLIERKPIAIKKCTIQKEYESRRDQKGKETTSTTTEKEVTDTGQDPKTLEKQKHTISRLLGGLPAKLGIVFFVFRMCVFFCFSKIPQVFGSCVYSNPLEPMKFSVQCIN